MACHGYLQLEGRTFLIEYIVRNCTYPLTAITGNEDQKPDPSSTAPTADVRVMCRNILNAFSSTIEGMDEVRIGNCFEILIKNTFFMKGFMAIINGISYRRNLYRCVWHCL